MIGEATCGHRKSIFTPKRLFARISNAFYRIVSRIYIVAQCMLGGSNANAVRIETLSERTNTEPRTSNKGRIYVRIIAVRVFGSIALFILRRMAKIYFVSSEITHVTHTIHKQHLPLSHCRAHIFFFCPTFLLCVAVVVVVAAVYFFGSFSCESRNKCVRFGGTRKTPFGGKYNKMDLWAAFRHISFVRLHCQWPSTVIPMKLNKKNE